MDRRPPTRFRKLTMEEQRRSLEDRIEYCRWCVAQGTKAKEAELAFWQAELAKLPKRRKARA
jgi:hypothetical protein